MTLHWTSPSDPNWTSDPIIEISATKMLTTTSIEDGGSSISMSLIIEYSMEGTDLTEDLLLGSLISVVDALETAGYTVSTTQTTDISRGLEEV